MRDRIQSCYYPTLVCATNWHLLEPAVAAQRVDPFRGLGAEFINLLRGRLAHPLPPFRRLVCVVSLAGKRVPARLGLLLLVFHGPVHLATAILGRINCTQRCKTTVNQNLLGYLVVAFF